MYSVITHIVEEAAIKALTGIMFILPPTRTVCTAEWVITGRAVLTPPTEFTFMGRETINAGIADSIMKAKDVCMDPMGSM